MFPEMLFYFIVQWFALTGTQNCYDLDNNGLWGMNGHGLPSHLIAICFANGDPVKTLQERGMGVMAS